MPKRTRFLLVLAWCLLYSPHSFAPDPEGFFQFELPEDAATKQHGFVVPNELYPQDGDPIFKAAGPGAYITVGTERGFIHFALATQTTHLILVDTDPDVARFNRINRRLLAAATSRTDYLRLRTTDNFELWKAAATRDGGKINAGELASDEDFKFWHQVRDFKGGKAVAGLRDRFASLEKPSADTISRQYFAKGNYLYDDELFERLSRAAKEGRIQVENFSLRSTANFRAMVMKLHEQKIPVSVFDMSNAWWQSFMPLSATSSLLRTCAEVGPKGIFIGTDRLKGGIENYNKQLPDLAVRKRKGWVYLGFPFAVIEKFGGPEPFMQFMFLDAERPERLAMLNDVTREPYQTRAGCVRAMGKTVDVPVAPPPR